MKTLTIFLIMTFSLIAQNKTVSLATGNDIKFNLDEFEQRYSLMPIQKSGRSEEYLKSEMLYSFLAEKLFAREAEKVGLDTSDIMKFTAGSMEKFIVRDKLYDLEITQKSKYSKEELKDALSKSRFVLDINYLFSQDKTEIEWLAKELANGETFDKILKSRKEYNLQREKYVVSFGDLEESIENVIFSLSPGEISPPIKSYAGWYIVRLNQVAEKNINDENKRKKELQNVKKIVEDRAEDKAYNKFFGKFFKNKKVNSDGYLFWSLSNQIIKVLSSKSSNNEKGEYYNLSSDDFYTISDNMGKDSLEMKFIFIDNDSISVKEFLHEFIFEGFYTDTLNPEIIRAKLKTRIKRFIENEILANEAYKRGLNQLPDVKAGIQQWHDYYLSELYKNNLAEKIVVDENEINNLLGKIDTNSSKEFVYVQEILVNNLNEIENILKLINSKLDFGELANKYSTRKSTKETKGVLGWLNSEDFYPIGEIALGLKIGEVYAPIKTNDGFSIIRVLDKKDFSKSAKIVSRMSREQISEKIKAKKLMNIMADEAVRIAKEQKLKVNQDQLLKSKVVNQKMMVYKYYGFGGRTLAFPPTPVFTKWVEKWEKSRSALP